MVVVRRRQPMFAQRWEGEKALPLDPNMSNKPTVLPGEYIILMCNDDGSVRQVYVCDADEFQEKYVQMPEVS